MTIEMMLRIVAKMMIIKVAVAAAFLHVMWSSERHWFSHPNIWWWCWWCWWCWCWRCWWWWTRAGRASKKFYFLSSCVFVAWNLKWVLWNMKKAFARRTSQEHFLSRIFFRLRKCGVDENIKRMRHEIIAFVIKKLFSWTLNDLYMINETSK